MANLLDLDLSKEGFDKLYADATSGCLDSIAAQPNSDATYDYTKRPPTEKTAAFVSSFISACLSKKESD